VPAGDGEVADWFRALREARDAAGDPAEFPAHLREQAAAFDPAMVEEFLRALAGTGDAERSLAELIELESQMPDLYWAYHPREDVAPVEDTPFGWVDDDQAAQLAAAWGGDWQPPLGEQLTARWGEGWESNPAEHKQAWFVDLLPELLPENDSEGASPDAVPSAVEQEVSAILDQVLDDELANLDADGDLSAEELNAAMAELRAELLTAPAATTQEG
jgi:hypothetical protein